MLIKSGVKTPQRATKDSIGYDFYAPYPIALNPGKWTTVNSGVYFTDGDKVDKGSSWALLLFPRSGHGFKNGVKLRNTVGVIDSDYRGEILASLSCEDQPFRIEKGEAFMQGIIIPRYTFDDEIVPEDERKGGFGSTDKAVQE